MAKTTQIGLGQYTQEKRGGYKSVPQQVSYAYYTGYCLLFSPFSHSGSSKITLSTVSPLGVFMVKTVMID